MFLCYNSNFLKIWQQCVAIKDQILTSLQYQIVSSRKCDLSKFLLMNINWTCRCAVFCFLASSFCWSGLAIKNIDNKKQYFVICLLDFCGQASPGCVVIVITVDTEQSSPSIWKDTKIKTYEAFYSRWPECTWSFRFYGQCVELKS